jgi:hypothetical protein
MDSDSSPRSSRAPGPTVDVGDAGTSAALDEFSWFARTVADDVADKKDDRASLADESENGSSLAIVTA